MKKKMLVLINVFIVLLEIIATYLSFSEFNFRLFTYYTQYSNILTLISSLLLIIYLLKNNVPKWLKFLRYVAVNMMSITFLVVAFVLVPMLVYAVGVKGFMMFTHGSMIFNHLLCPVLLFLSYVFLEKWNPITKKDKTYVLIPTLIYGVILIILNATKVVDGPYPFLMVDEMPIYISVVWFLGIFLFVYFIGCIIYKFGLKKVSL